MAEMEKELLQKNPWLAQNQSEIDALNEYIKELIKKKDFLIKRQTMRHGWARSRMIV